MQILTFNNAGNTTLFPHKRKASDSPAVQFGQATDRVDLKTSTSSGMDLGGLMKAKYNPSQAVHQSRVYTVQEVLNMALEKPGTMVGPHYRARKVMDDAGIVEETYLGMPRRRILFFEKIYKPGHDRLGKALYGADFTTDIYDYFDAGAKGEERGRRMLTVIGEPGCGKSTALDKLMEGVALATKSTDPAIVLHLINLPEELGLGIKEYTDPAQMHPLMVLPEEVREHLQGQINQRMAQEGIDDRSNMLLQGKLTGSSEWIVNALKDKYKSEFLDTDEYKQAGAARREELEQEAEARAYQTLLDKHVRGLTQPFSYEKQIGLGYLTMKPLKDFDTAHITGEPNATRAAILGGDHPVAWDHRVGAAFRAGGGILHASEVFRGGSATLSPFYPLLQERLISTGTTNDYARLAAVGTTNLDEYKSAMSDGKNAGVQERIYPVRALPPLDYRMEKSHIAHVIEKTAPKSVKVAPYTDEFVAYFAVLSRLLAPDNGGKDALPIKAKLYAEQHVEGYDVERARQWFEEGRARNEGWSEISISPRVIEDIFSDIWKNDEVKKTKSLDVLLLADIYRKMIDNNQFEKLKGKDALKKDLKARLDIAEKEYMKKIMDDVREALQHDETKLISYMTDYVKRLIAVTRFEAGGSDLVGYKDSFGRLEKPEESKRKLEEYEKFFPLKEKAMSAEGFRKGLAIRAMDYLGGRKEQTFDAEFLTAKGNEILREGIGKYIAREQQNMVPRHVIVDPASSLTEQEAKDKNNYLKRMEQKGYSEASAIRAFERYLSLSEK